MEIPRSRPLSGVLYVVVVALTIGFTIQVYRKAMPWQDAVSVTVTGRSAGLGLNPHSDVKLQGRLVGEVRSVTSNGSRAAVTLALEPDEVRHIPRNVEAAILPKTLFGEKYVDLRVPAVGRTGSIGEGDVIALSATAVELGEVFAKLEPVLRDVEPAKLASILQALSVGLDGNGQDLAKVVRNLDRTLADLEPQLDRMVEDLRLAGEVAEDYADIAPELIKVLEASTKLSDDLLVDRESDLHAVLSESSTAARKARQVLDANADRIITVTEQSQPLLELLRDYSGALPCFIEGLHTTDTLANQTFAARGPYLDALIDSFAAHAPYRYPADLPTNPESDGHDSNLPPLVPSWRPHCPTFRPDALALPDSPPFAYVRGAATGTAGAPSGDGRGDPAVARVREMLDRLMGGPSR